MRPLIIQVKSDYVFFLGTLYQYQPRAIKCRFCSHDISRSIDDTFTLNNGLHNRVIVRVDSEIDK